MNKRVAQVALLVLLVTVLVTVVSPIYECFDRWDNPVAGGNDTVLTLVGTLTIAGLALVLRLAIPKIFGVLGRIGSQIRCELTEQSFRWFARRSAPRSPPLAPLPLRI